MAFAVDDLAYRRKNPGAVKFGNFINYYSFHKTGQRVKHFHSSMFPINENNDDIVCLDIGCNTGELTAEVFEYVRNIVYPRSTIHMLGIDIDPVLIQRANDHKKSANITYVKSNIMNLQDREIIQQYLNIHKKTKFDVVLCFSVTMWIHINNGDKDFLEFLQYIKEHARAIIIEPQPWKCYRNAQRRMIKSGSNFPFFESLQIRNNVETIIELTIKNNGFSKVYESPPSEWNRKIQCYHLLSYKKKE